VHERDTQLNLFCVGKTQYIATHTLAPPLKALLLRALRGLDNG